MPCWPYLQVYYYAHLINATNVTLVQSTICSCLEQDPLVFWVIFLHTEMHFSQCNQSGLLTSQSSLLHQLKLPLKSLPSNSNYYVGCLLYVMSPLTMVLSFTKLTCFYSLSTKTLYCLMAFTSTVLYIKFSFCMFFNK